MLWSIIVFFIVLSILVIVHELGHYWVAKKNGILVEEFGFGIPPRIWGKKIGETLYSINLLPFGGFVKLYGELTDPSINNTKDVNINRAFINKSKKVKIAVVVAGVLMNFILAVFAFSLVYSFTGVPRETKEVKILDVTSGSPAQGAKLVVGDVVYKVDGKEVKKVSEFIAEIDTKKGKKVTLELRDRKVTIVPRANPPQGEGPLGVSVSSTETYFPPIYLRPVYGIYYGFKEALFWGENVLNGLYSIFASLLKGNVPKDVSGPVGVFAVTSQAAKVGILSLVNLIGIISVNLAILNILPFPALDGGRLLFIVIEKVVGRKVLPKIESTIHAVGMLILIALIIMITIHDVKGLISAGSISAFLENMVK